MCLFSCSSGWLRYLVWDERWQCHQLCACSDLKFKVVFTKFAKKKKIFFTSQAMANVDKYSGMKERMEKEIWVNKLSHYYAFIEAKLFSFLFLISLPLLVIQIEEFLKEQKLAWNFFFSKHDWMKEIFWNAHTYHCVFCCLSGKCDNL